MAKSTSVKRSPNPFSRQPMILVPLDPNRSGTVAQRTYRATRWLWSRGVYPSPSAVNCRMRGETRDCLNGIETKVRNMVMNEIGISRQRRDQRFKSPGAPR